MLELLLMRHATAEPPKSGQADFDRPLTSKGGREIEVVVRHLFEEGIVPDLILSSPSNRTKSTGAQLLTSAGWSCLLEMKRELYHGESEAFVEVLNEVENRFRRVLVVAHNPGLQEFCEMLTQRSHGFRTASIALIRTPISSWSELRLSTEGELLGFFSP